MTSTLRFELAPFEEDRSHFTVVPVIDGDRLTDVIHRFERAAGMERRDDSYDGLVPAANRFASAAEHHLTTDGKIPVLGPFSFARPTYDEAVSELARRWDPAVGR